MVSLGTGITQVEVLDGLAPEVVREIMDGDWVQGKIFPFTVDCWTRSLKRVSGDMIVDDIQDHSNTYVVIGWLHGRQMYAFIPKDGSNLPLANLLP